MIHARHSIKSVARRTGLSAHVIRIWEKRYGAVKPQRSGTNRRLYSDEEIERLSLLREVTRAGHNIGAVATVPTGKLRKMATEGVFGKRSEPDVRATSPEGRLLTECLTAVNALDAHGLEATLNRGSVEFGGQGLLQRVIAPLAVRIGELWRDGVITAAHEHFASAVIRVFLGHASRSFASSEGVPVLVVGTPIGQLHELGALLAGAAAANLGWHVTYVGPGLPAAEIAGAASQSHARAVALSLVYPEDDPKLDGELTRLRQLLPAEVPLLVGGRAAPAYRTVLRNVGAEEFSDLAHFSSALDDLRKPALRQRK